MYYTNSIDYRLLPVINISNPALVPLHQNATFDLSVEELPFRVKRVRPWIEYGLTETDMQIVIVL